MSRLEYLAELNRRLMEHPGYRPGMEFAFSPPGATCDEAHGFNWLPADAVEPMRSIALAAAEDARVPEVAPRDGDELTADEAAAIASATAN